MKIIKGVSARDFEASAYHQGNFKLSDFSGRKVMLSFYRNVACPFCNFRIHKLMKYKPKWEDKLHMIMVFESEVSVMKHSRVVDEIPPEMIISDPKKTLYELYGVEDDLEKLKRTSFPKTGNSEEQYLGIKAAGWLNPEIKENTSGIYPADILIDENFKVFDVFYGKAINDHIPIERIEDFIGMKLY